MSKPLRTNPAFAHLAYRKAILNRLVVFMRRNYIGDELSEPKEVLICEDVLPVDSQVPQEEVQHCLESLTDEVAQIDVELRKFEFVPRGQNAQQKSQKEAGNHRSPGGKGPGKGPRPH